VQPTELPSCTLYSNPVPCPLQVPTGKAWPHFSWLEPSAPPVNGYTYQLWGKANPQNQAEPNNLMRDEMCAMANNTISHMGGQMQAWAWSDTRCNLTSPFICKLSRECSALRVAGADKWYVC
jgi:hypothetical protein